MIACLAAAAALLVASVAAAAPATMVFVEAGAPKATETLGKEWVGAAGAVECAGDGTIAHRILGRCSVGAGDFRVTARLALVKLANSSAAFSLGDNSFFGFAGGHGKVFITGPLFNNAWGTPIGEPSDFMKEGVPFQFGFHREGGKIRVLIDGKQVYEQAAGGSAVGPVGFTPVRATVRLYEFSATGNLEPYRAPVIPGPRKENIVLDPRVKAVPDLPLGPFVRLGDGSILGMGGTEALVTRDGGKTWEKRPIFTAEQKMKLSNERALLRTRAGALILIFANYAVLKYSWDKEKNVPLPDMHLPSYSIRSLDDGKSWTDANLLHDGWCGCIQDVIQTSKGSVVVPGQELLYREGRHVTLPYVSTDDGRSWTRTRTLDIGGQGDHAGAVEGTLEELRDGRLWMLIRTPNGFFYESYSSDQGMTWSDPKPSAIKSTGSPGKMKRLASGRLALLWNPPPSPGFKVREELSLSFSEDDGKTWTPPQVIATNKGGRVSYPHLFEHAPGELWVTTMQGGLRAGLREADFLK